VTYPHPTLRHKSKPVRRVDAELRATVRQMFELMYEANGMGLAANQVDLPLRLFVVNVGGASDNGEELVFINPVLSRPKGLEEKEEGCLSFPELYATVRRSKRIRVNAYDLNGQEITAEFDGLLGRAVQHEYDHLDGMLFIDRMSPVVRLDVKDALDDLVTEFQSRRVLGEIPSDEEIFRRLNEWEQRYC
jgi:peptide deformylase